MVIVYVVTVIALNIAFRNPSIDSDDDPRHLISVLVPLIVYLVSGFVTGFVARRSPVMHGMLLGSLLAVVFLIPWLVLALIPSSWLAPPSGGIFDNTSWWAFLRLASVAGLVCSFGAIVGDYFSSRRQAP